MGRMGRRQTHSGRRLAVEEQGSKIIFIEDWQGFMQSNDIVILVSDSKLRLSGAQDLCMPFK